VTQAELLHDFCRTASGAEALIIEAESLASNRVYRDTPCLGRVNPWATRTPKRKQGEVEICSTI